MECDKRMTSYMGEHFLSVKYALFMSLFVSFHHDLESKLVIREPEKKPVDKNTKDSNGIELFFIAGWLNLKQLTMKDL